MFIFKQREKIKDIEKKSKQLSSELGLEQKTAEILLLRGIDNKQSAEFFFNPAKEKLHDAYLFEDMQKAVDRINTAIKNKEKIMVFGDYDADGICATAILYKHLTRTGADVSYYLPDRFKDGYGLNTNAIEKFAQQEISLIIAVDLGITNVIEVKTAQNLGIDIIIADHHECPQVLPEAYAIINPKRKDSAYPFRHLCGAGLAFKLVCALGGINSAMEYIDIAAVATIADIVPLFCENRIIAKLGIDKVNSNASAGLLALMNVLNLNKVNSTQVAFQLAPKINAASRMGFAGKSLELLLSNELNEETFLMARKLLELNDKRKSDEEIIIKSANNSVRQLDFLSDYAVFIEGDNFNAGVIGIAAAYFSEKLYRPVIVLSMEENNYVGSVRSIAEVNIYSELYKFSDLFIKFGGHSQAAGLSITKENLGVLKRNLNESLAVNYPKDTFIPKKRYDCEIELSEINKKLISELEALAPFGEKNNVPVFLLKDTKISEHTFVGKQEKIHLKARLSAGEERNINSIMFNYKNNYEYLCSKNDCLITLGINDYDYKPQAQICAITPGDFKAHLTSYIKSGEGALFFSHFEYLCKIYSGRKLKNLGGKAFYSKLKQDSFGFAIVMDSLVSARKIYKDENIIKLYNDKKIDIYFSKQPLLPLNTLLCSVDVYPGFKNIYHYEGGSNFSGAKAIEEHKYFCEYKKLACEYFLERNKLISFYKTIKQAYDNGVNGRREELLAQISIKTGFNLGQVCFALAVFNEINLINLNISDIMKFNFIENEEKCELEGSNIYCIAKELFA